MDVIEAVKNRKSIRAYKNIPVDDTALNTVLEAARLAPSWANTQTWRFVVIKNQDIKERLIDTSLRANNRGIEAIREAPIVIAACAEVNRAGCRNGEPLTDKEGYWFMFDVALAMQNLVLAAESLGLGTVYLGGFDAKKVEGILGIPAGYRIVAMTPLGYPDESPEAKSRKELSEIIFYDSFSSK
jgi:nitroreductase